MQTVGVILLLWTLFVKVNSFGRLKISAPIPVKLSNLRCRSSISEEIANTASDEGQKLTLKRYPIGSQPDFALPDDSTIENNSQRTVVLVHFLLFFVNVFMSLKGMVFSSVFDMAQVILVFVLSIVVGDFGTGVFHWSVDNYGGINTPIFGKVCVAFQGHHDTPWTITFRSFANNVYKIAYGSIPALAILTVAPCNESVRLFFALFANWWLLSQEFHKWSHMRTTPPGIKFAQNCGLILSKKEHGLHHTEPFNNHYCILTGICNPFLDNINFFGRLEKIVYKLTGNKPNCCNLDQDLDPSRL